MTIAVLDSKNKKDQDLLTNFAKLNDLNLKFIKNKDLEDYALNIAIEEGRKNDFIDEDDFLSELLNENSN